MVACSCNQDADKDGCYRCLLAYRNSYGMESTSRDAAVKLLSDILEHEDTFEEVESIRDIEANPLFDSELEARFIDAIKRLALDGLDIQIQQQVIQGKPGYFLKVNEFLYTIEPQVNLGSQQGTEYACCPDFFIKSAQEAKQLKPVCVFLDGYKYHADNEFQKSNVGKDSAKRMALVQSGKYHVWSLTWDDVQAKDRDITGFYTELFPQRTQNFTKTLATYEDKFKIDILKLKDINLLNSYDLLINYLADPDDKAWEFYAFLQGILYIASNAKLSYSEESLKNINIIKKSKS
jgi:DEAD/DEAH box helicase domain-containing protein